MATTDGKKKAFDLGSLGVPMGPVVKKPAEKSYLVYSRPGAGKSTLAASAAQVPDLGPVLLIDFEAGTTSLEGLYDETDPLTIIRPENWQQANDIFAALLDEEHGYKTVIIDTIGKMMQFMDTVYEKKFSANPFERWSALADTSLQLVEDLHKSHLNVIVLAHDESEKDDKRGSITTYPYFLGRKTGKEAPKIFDVIGYLYVEEDDDQDDGILRVLQTVGTGGVTAKSRITTLPHYLGQPDFKKIYGYAQEHGKK